MVFNLVVKKIGGGVEKKKGEKWEYPYGKYIYIYIGTWFILELVIFELNKTSNNLSLY